MQGQLYCTLNVMLMSCPHSGCVLGSRTAVCSILSLEMKILPLSSGWLNLNEMISCNETVVAVVPGYEQPYFMIRIHH
jgi:hypothetical protein